MSEFTNQLCTELVCSAKGQRQKRVLRVWCSRALLRLQAVRNGLAFFFLFTTLVGSTVRP